MAAKRVLTEEQKAARRAYLREYRQKYPEKFTASVAASRAKKAEYYKQKDREYREKNKEHKSAYFKEYRAKNREALKKQNREYYLANRQEPTRIVNTYTQEQKDEAIRLRKEGFGPTEIAEKLSIPHRTLSYWLSKHEADFPAISLYTQEQWDRAFEMRRSGVEVTQIAQETGINRTTLKQRLLENNIILDPKDYSSQLQNAASSRGFEVFGTYQSSSSKMEFRCPKGHVFKMAPNTFLSGHGCKTCVDTAKKGARLSHNAKYTWEDLFTVLSGIGFKLINPPDEPVTNKAYALVNENKEWLVQCRCGRNYHPRLSDVMLGKLKSCGCDKSGPERDIAALIGSWGFDYTLNDRTVLDDQISRCKEIDVFVPSLNIGIEFCGIWYHSELCSPDRARSRHVDKWKLATQKGIRLITIFEDEWRLKREQTEGYLRAIFNKNTTKIGARKCQIQTVGTDQARVFLDNNHIQGAVSGKHFGLYNSGKLVSLLTVRVPNRLPEHLKGKPVIEIARFCNLISTSIPGAFSKLLAEASRYYSGAEYAITYSDNRWSSGNLYQVTGFEASHVTQPSYWYFRKNSSGPRIHKSNLSKRNLLKLFPDADPSMTEWDIAKQRYNRIWDCGTTTWVKKLR